MNRKNTIPIIDSCSLDLNNKTTIHIDDLSEYVIKHANMVFPHKHNFFHFVLFTKGSGDHIIDFNHYKIKPFQIYFMAPGQVHTWNFVGDEGAMSSIFGRLFPIVFITHRLSGAFQFFTGQN
ncbi:cupin domain-containing protein [Sphingobacterium sp. E70]|uniref:cupin domain-containing protein n=1 Tax=Sphingobacterium sp. E70 TaxID=2853439 RepID=UPI00359C67E1